ncbi:MAG: hypothetical protein ACI86H_000743 [bacterium]|jgi:hypothetical protein
MSILVKNKSMMKESLKKKFPDAVVIDVTSKATDDWLYFSPFYPIGNIPVPFSPNTFAQSIK